MKKSAVKTVTLVGAALALLLAGAPGCSASATVGPANSGCSTSSTTNNGAVACVTGTTAWTCTGDALPEDTNADLVCSGDGAGDYCCSTSTCTFDSTVTSTCGSGAQGYSCASGAEPPDQNDPTLLCSEPATANNIDTYCCFTNTEAPPSSSTCAQDTTVSGCQPNSNGEPSYGFSCTGTENPDTDFSNLTCSTTGTPGANGTDYCCVYN